MKRPFGEVVERERVHRARRRRARRDLHDAGAQPDAFGVRADPRRRRERVGAPRLRGPHRVEAELLRFLRERDRERVGLRAPVAELQARVSCAACLGTRARAVQPRTDCAHGAALRRRDRRRLAGLDAVVAARARTAGRRAERLLIVLDDVGFAQLGCYGSDIATPEHRPPRGRGRAARQLPHHRAVLADPRRACSPGATTTATAWAASPTSPSAIPGYWGTIPRENGFLSEILRAHGYATYAVGKWHLTPDDETHMAGDRSELAARPRLRPLVRLPRRRDAPVRARRSTTTTTRCCRRARPRRATTSARTSPTTRSSTSATSAPSTPSSRSSSTSRPARATRRTTRRRSGSSATAASSTTGWDAWRERDASPASSSAGIVPAGTELSPRPPWVPAWDDARRPRTRRSRRASWSASPAFLSHTDAQIGRVLDVPRARPATSTTRSIVARLRQRRERRRRRARLDQRRPHRGTAIPAGRRELRGAHRRARRPDRAQQLPVGLDDGRQHAVPALEARGARGRRRRSVHRALARAASPTRGEIRHQFAHAIDVLPTVLELVGVDAARPRSTASQQSPDRGHELRVRCSTTRRRARAAHARSTSRCSARRGIYHDGWKAVTFKPLGAMYDDGLDPDAPFDDDVWELYHVAEDLSEMPRPRRARSPSGSPR